MLRSAGIALSHVISGDGRWDVVGRKQTSGREYGMRYVHGANLAFQLRQQGSPPGCLKVIAATRIILSATGALWQI